jgi:hypothetical protein
MVLEVSAGLEERKIEEMSQREKVKHLSDTYCDNGCLIRAQCHSSVCAVKALLNKIEGREN